MLIVERTYTLAFRSNVHVPSLRRGLLRRLERGDADGAHRLVLAALPAWPARCVEPLVDPELEDDERAFELEERLMDATADATRWMRPLRASATIASALGFIGAAIEINWVFNGEHGLAALQAGRVESEGLGAAVVSIAIGIATSSLALGSWSALKGAATARVQACRALAAAVEEVLFGPLEPEPADQSADGRSAS